MLRLDLGSGPHPEPGYQGVDIQPVTDYQGDLSSFPWAFSGGRQGPVLWELEDSGVEAIHCSHLVEHMVDLVGFMRELYRVCAPGAEVFIKHPYQFNVRAWQDPTHVRCINEVSWFYFDAKWRGEYAGGSSEFGDTDFELVELNAIPEPAWQDVATNTPEDFERAARNQINVIADLHVILRCRK